MSTSKLIAVLALAKLVLIKIEDYREVVAVLLLILILGAWFVMMSAGPATPPGTFPTQEYHPYVLQ